MLLKGAKIQKNIAYGHFRVCKRLSKKWFGCKCILCKEKIRFTKSELLALPHHEDCPKQKEAEDNIVEVEESGVEIIREPIFSVEKENQLRNLIQAQERASVQASILFSAKVLSMLLDLIPRAEIIFCKYPNRSNADALSLLLQQARESIADLEAQQQSNIVLINSLTTTLHPAFLDIGKILLENYYQFRELYLPFIPTEKQESFDQNLDQLIRDVGAKIQKIYEEAREKLIAQLGSEE